MATRRTASIDAAPASRRRPDSRRASQVVTGADSTMPTSIAALNKAAASSPPRSTASRLNIVQPSDEAERVDEAGGDQLAQAHGAQRSTPRTPGTPPTKTGVGGGKPLKLDA